MFAMCDCLTTMNGLQESSVVHHSTSGTTHHGHVSCTSVGDLPQEVLTQIFSFLSASERGNVRRACSTWYDACNVSRILGTEKLRIQGADLEGSLLVFETLLACQLKYLNLEFDKFQFGQYSIFFWEHFGQRISSLTLCGCSFEDSSFKGILINCPNLLSLEINNDFDERLNNAIASGMTSCNFILRSLTSLRFKNCRFLNDFIYTTMIRSFPNVRELFFEHVNINCYKRVDRRFYLTEAGPYNREDIFSFTCVFDHLRSIASQIKNLSFHSIGDSGLTSDWLDDIAMLTDLRLNSLSLEGHCLFSEPSLINFISKQTTLTKLIVHRCARISYSALRKVTNMNIEFS